MDTFDYVDVAILC